MFANEWLPLNVCTGSVPFAQAVSPPRFIRLASTYACPTPSLLLYRDPLKLPMTEEMLGKDGHSLTPDLLGPPVIETTLEVSRRE